MQLANFNLLKNINPFNIYQRDLKMLEFIYSMLIIIELNQLLSQNHRR